jgi:3-dehydroquinate synthase
MGEVIKHALIRDAELLDLLESRLDDLMALEPELTTHVIARNMAIKGAVVSEDERETGGVRELLNYGHTLGHALERLAGYTGLRHGEAVSLGMVFAARIAERTGLAEPGLADGHVRLLARVGLPVGGVELDPDEVLAAMATDKKRLGGLRLVLLRAPGRPVLLPAPGRDVLVGALRSLAGGAP